jgi:YVTN family beta-propeller protein
MATDMMLIKINGSGKPRSALGERAMKLRISKSIAAFAVSYLLSSAPTCAQKVYITNYRSNNVSVIDTTINKVIATASGIISPYGVAVSPDRSKAYVTGVSGAISNISVIDTASDTIIGTISYPLQGGAGAVGIAFSPDGKEVYVTNTRPADTLSVIDTRTNTVIATIPVGDNPVGLAVSPNGSKVYVANYDDDHVSVIDTATNTVVANIPAISSGFGVAITPDGSKVYVTNLAGVSVIQALTDSVIATIAVGLSNTNPYGLAVTPDGSKVYVANEGSLALQQS